MLTIILTIIGREIVALVLRTLTRRDLEAEIDKIDFLRDGLLHGLAKKIQPFIERQKQVFNQTRQLN